MKTNSCGRQLNLTGLDDGDVIRLGSLLAGHDIETATDTHNHGYIQFFFIPRNPFFLFGCTQAYHKYIRLSSLQLPK